MSCVYVLKQFAVYKRCNYSDMRRILTVHAVSGASVRRVNVLTRGEAKEVVLTFTTGICTSCTVSFMIYLRVEVRPVIKFSKTRTYLFEDVKIDKRMWKDSIFY